MQNTMVGGKGKNGHLVKKNKKIKRYWGKKLKRGRKNGGKLPKKTGKRALKASFGVKSLKFKRGGGGMTEMHKIYSWISDPGFHCSGHPAQLGRRRVHGPRVRGRPQELSRKPARNQLLGLIPLENRLLVLISLE